MSKNRVSEIDGIRGWAALCVLFFHLIWEIFGVVRPDFRISAVRFVLDGPLAVCIFFILSGDALSLGFTSANGRGVSPGMVLKRYFRLAGPVLFSCAVVYALMKAGLVFNKEAGLIVGRQDWLGAFIQFDPSFFKMIHHGLLEAFTNLSVGNAYNPFLWPMGIELVGSLVVFCFGFLIKTLKSPERILCFVAAFLWALGSYYALFFIGVLFGILRDRNFFSNLRVFPKNRVVVALALVFVAFMDGVAEYYSFRKLQFMIIMAFFTVFVCYSSRDIASFMDHPLSKFFGKISFPLYFMHFSVIVSYTSWLIVSFHEERGAAYYLFVIVSSAIISIILAFLVEFLEAFYLRKVNNMIIKVLN